MMKCGKLFCAIVLVMCAAFSSFGALEESLQKAAALREIGDFKGAAALLNDALKQEGLSPSDHNAVLFQIDLLERIRQDYSQSEDDMFAEISDVLKGFSREEFNRWIGENYFDVRLIDGKRRFLGSSLSNLFFRYPELEGRRVSPASRSAASAQRVMLENARKIKKASIEKKTPYVLPCHYKCSMTVTAKKNAAPAGETIRAWVPIPRAYPFQTDFKILSSSPDIKVLAPDSSPIRSAYFEQAAQKDKATRFQVTYEYTAHCVHFEMNPDSVTPASASDPELGKYLCEAPHVVFTPAIRKLASELAADKASPMLKAKAFFDWIADNIKYSYAREYSTLTNISDYCLSHRYGDCGQEALLFITLCRSAGIPARWQTGWHLVPGAKTNHDWTEIYLAPYGWVPCDPWAGIHAMRYCTTLSPAERKELRDFYFGGNDQWRMAANSDHNQQFTPPKKTMRSDDVDFQRGELEYGDTNIYFDKFSYSLDVHEAR